ncbi:MAG: hypothetical protein SCM11_07600 [Bacillota bacterium]|nr:hypothetical protein [Bacillota bacterium]
MNQNTFKMTGVIIALLVSLLVLLLVWRSFGNLQTRSRESGLQTVEAAVAQTVMQCYALEGAYPPNLEYLQTHYGLILDEAHYAFVYEVVGDNIYPIIDVQFLEDVRQ